MHAYTQTAVDWMEKLLNVPSPTGYTDGVSAYLVEVLQGMGYEPERLNKGTVRVQLGGVGEAVALSAHVDTLGLMVRDISGAGRLYFTRLGGPLLQAVETENVTIYTREGKAYTGVVQLRNASAHVNGEAGSEKRTIDTMEVLLDEEVSSKADVEKLGIANGDVICLEPRLRVTPSGYVRSRFLDDKLSAGMLLALAQQVAEGKLSLKKQVTLMFTVYEEVGHGASHGVPADVTHLLVVDMGCVGDGLSCTEQQVSICAKDSAGPYDWGMTSELIALAKEHKIDYAVDVYPYYGSDAGAALAAGGDLRCALIGAGVYASHGYERTHIKGISNTLKLMEAYL